MRYERRWQLIIFWVTSLGVDGKVIRKYWIGAIESFVISSVFWTWTHSFRGNSRQHNEAWYFPRLCCIFTRAMITAYSIFSHYLPNTMYISIFLGFCPNLRITFNQLLPIFRCRSLWFWEKRNTWNDQTCFSSFHF